METTTIALIAVATIMFATIQILLADRRALTKERDRIGLEFKKRMIKIRNTPNYVDEGDW